MESPDPVARPVLVLDFGAQYVQLIARRVRERHAFARIVRHDIPAERVRELNPLALILSGGPASVYEPGAPALRPAALRTGCPDPGDLLRHATGVRGPGRQGPGRHRAREFGRAECRVLDPDEPLFHDVPRETTVWMSHGDQVHDAGADFIPLAATATCPIAAVRHRDRPFYGLQFHPEVSHTPYGSLILGNFLDRICQSPRQLDDGGIHRAVHRRDRRGGSARPTGSSAGSPEGSIRRSARRCWPGARAAGGLRLRRQRTAPRRRAGGGGRGVRRPTHAELRVVDAADRFLDALDGVDRSPGEAGTDRPHVHRRLSRRGPVDPRRAVPGAGHALPRRDRERRRARRSGGDDQDHHNVGGLPPNWASS